MQWKVDWWRGIKGRTSSWWQFGWEIVWARAETIWAEVEADWEGAATGSYMHEGGKGKGIAIFLQELRN